MADTTRRLYLVRHGVTAWNREMRLQGHSDVPLDPEGLEQAHRLGRRLASCPSPPQAVWSSDLMRARQTAEAIAAPLGLLVQTTPMLRETMLGTWEGLTGGEIEARGEAALFRLYQRDSYGNRPPGSENFEVVWERMTQICTQICAEQPDADIAIVGHGGSLRALLCAALHAPITSLRHITLSNASLSIIEEVVRGGERFQRVTLMNDTSHVDAPSASV